MANVEKAERKAAPAVEVKMPHRDQREGIRLVYAEKDPDYSYAYHRPNVTDAELARISAEKVSDGKGGFAHHEGDPLIRIPRKIAEAQRAQEQEESFRTVKNKMKVADRAGRLSQQKAPKVPKPPDIE